MAVRVWGAVGAQHESYGQIRNAWLRVEEM